ncbi:Glycosyltransferase involved in cell wall bisynthesis [Clostridium cavendishii DSM 21758]|uniref:Glycosyltransferase involved in cell wall bisynthesis n=1 Tax=Clostridium cavendishii DSM 21758 TaxID=1121302 RepID=A0A1M6Q8Y0_9CLOT|nr:glycosyltransferase family 4 protein [Clostridium cavendishii]SHK16712.1 Glycosyltransferase involved in cell wall bisynthesis [Clostridium cavendishii DSM 21758]
MISNMYPNKKHPSYGVFVKNFEKFAAEQNIDVNSVVMFKANNKVSKILKYMSFYIRVIFKILFSKYDIVYVHFVSMSSIPVLIANKFKKFKIYTNVHGSDVIPKKKSDFKLQKFAKKILKISEVVVVPSNYFKKYIVENFEIEFERIKVFPSGGIDEKLFVKKGEEYINLKKNEFNIATNEKIYSFVGRIEEAKGWETLIKAIEILKKKNCLENMRFIIIGNGSENNKFLESLEKSNIKDKIIKINLLDQKELVDIYNISDYFIFPSYSESLGLVGLEAMACGTPVIGSNISAIREYLINGYNGYLFETKNSNELAKILEDTLNLNDNQYKALNSNSIVTSQAYYKKNIGNLFNKIFEVAK